MSITIRGIWKLIQKECTSNIVKKDQIFFSITLRWWHWPLACFGIHNTRIGCAITTAGRILILMNLTFLKPFLEGTSFLEYIFFGHKSMNYISYYITFKNISLRFSTAFHNGFLCSFSSVHKPVKHPGTCIILHSCVVPGKMLSGWVSTNIVKATVEVTMDTNQPTK